MEDNVAELQKHTSTALFNALNVVCKKIAPAWSLQHFVAVNPYMGLTELKFTDAAKDLAVAAGIQMTLPVSFYLKKLEEQQITINDVAIVLSKKYPNEKSDVNVFLNKLRDFDDTEKQSDIILTVADTACKATGKDWGRFVTTRVAAWAATYFDQGQAIWATTNPDESIYTSWKKEAAWDFNPEIMGLAGFRAFVKSLPDNPLQAAQFALGSLGIPEEGLSIYLHRLLLRVGGWAAYIARVDFDNKLYGNGDEKLVELLAILICWEACLLNTIKDTEIQLQWRDVCANLALAPIKGELDSSLTRKLILQEAFDLAMQNKLIARLQSSQQAARPYAIAPKAHAIFCIDVRSEVFRRNMELVDNAIETLGFAGFFAFPIKYIPLGQQEGQAQCPVLLKTGPVIAEEIPENKLHKQAVTKRILTHQVNQLWKSFKSGAVSCFSFVSPMGLFYLPKLFTDSFGITRPVPHPDSTGLTAANSAKTRVSLSYARHGKDTLGIPLDQQVEMAKNALTAMSLTSNFAPFVLIVGHGSTSVNNPHATGLDCGACGGHTGEANAKVAAEILNDELVRKQLNKSGIYIPENTMFMACLHDTTTDKVTVYNEYILPADRVAEWKDVKISLELAGKASRAERLLRMAVDPNQDADDAIMARSKDWSQIRPEWGLAGCSAFVVAPRSRTKGINLGGKSFLHSYEWEKDHDFKVLELIMTAPMVVTSWINLQYYASTTDNKTFGSGNKALHNITAGVGVVEGSSGDLRIGLPWQSVHDGAQYQHEPLRLSVVIEAPLKAMNDVLKKHASVRNLCDNNWIYLLAMDTEGKVSHRYTGNYTWEIVNQPEAC
ncbi:DUF2309 domain-containing protein [Mucilaginibacter terrenus]|uniref:Probable inorganic carbon transporter subunit DabA n=2 Tax=Mucilaginibacter terrenus TaxID=2482727 RepID=A0A3E2NYI3_9SPHI|nr:DUF2309 domain-containing protein [Mucilaginibacter terrenus]